MTAPRIVQKKPEALPVINEKQSNEAPINNEENNQTKTDFFYIFQNECTDVLEMMKDQWNVQAENFNLSIETALTRSSLESKADGILIMESWNKVLAFRSMFSEAILARWRMLTAISFIRNSTSKVKRPSLLLDRYSKSTEQHEVSDSQQALYLVEKNFDPLATAFSGFSMCNLETLIVGFIDMAVRELCPHNQIVLREAYRPISGSHDPDPNVSNIFMGENECLCLEDYCILLARYGLKPAYWIDFCEAFVWAMKTHNPYAHQDQDVEDFEKLANESIHGKFAAGMIALPMVEAMLREENHINKEIFSQLQIVYYNLQNELDVNAFEHGLEALFRERPDLSHYFGENEVNFLIFDLLTLMQLLVQNLDQIKRHDSEVRLLLTQELASKWLQKQVPCDFVPLLGNIYLDAAKKLIRKKENLSFAIKLESALSFLSKEAMHFVMLPLIKYRNLRKAAAEFYKEIATELQWSNEALQKRMVEVNAEILSTDTYTQTSEEIEIGSRLAWRNSGKCIGRIAWNTLEVRDCRHLFSADTIFQEVEEHIELASGGTNIKSVMTIFRPQHPREAFGMRFWSSQLFRYAGYKDAETGKVLGDPANADFTDYLINSKLWNPPATRSAFDLLPLVLKMPQIRKPFVYEIPETLRHEVKLEHPDFPAVKELGLKWAAIPAITNFKLNLGGVIYPCIPFNGWFMSTEIARNLLERYQMTIPFAEAFKIPSSDRMLSQKVASEVENAILHSFEKEQYTIVDPMTAGQSYMTHCKRERKAGRECPGQWSWIGGLVGPTNPTWHLEMRDFKKEPQYDFGCDPWKVISIDESFHDQLLDTTQHKLVIESMIVKKRHSSVKLVQLPRLLIAYGSETGTAEAAASSLARKLKACKPKVMSLNDVARNVDKITGRFTHFLAICSTFGNGEPPTNAKAFFEMNIGSMSRVNCAVLALGSSLYPKFCQAGKDLNAMIMDAGGDSLMKLTCIDSVEDSQSQITQWAEQMKKLILPDSLLLDLAEMENWSTNEKADGTYEIQWQKNIENPSTKLEPFIFPSRSTMLCKKNYELFGVNDSNRSTRNIDFKLPQDVTYEAGDHLSVCPVNDILLVRRFLHCFTHELEKAALDNGFTPSTNEINGDNNNDFLSPAVIWQAQQHFDVMKEEYGELVPADIPHLTDKSLVDILQAQLSLSLFQEAYVEDLLSFLMEKLESSTLTSSLVDAFKQHYEQCKKKRISASYPTIVHLFEKFGPIFFEPHSDDKKSLISLADILVLMPRLTPRYYSISSSAQVTPKTVSITVGVLNTKTSEGQLLKGVCSNYLARLQPGDRAKVSVKKSLFRKTKAKNAPMILVGSGTGIAPLMAFLRERAKDWYSGSNRNVGECHLFFGCRSKDEILYHDELSSLRTAKLMNLHLAFSRDPNTPKQYVTDQMIKNAVQLSSLLQKDNVHLYICGDAAMASASTKVFIEILMNVGEMSRVSAVQAINQMRVDDRFQYDIYGTADLSDTWKEKEDASKKKLSPKSGSIWSERYIQNVVLDKTESKEDLLEYGR